MENGEGEGEGWEIVEGGQGGWVGGAGVAVARVGRVGARGGRAGGRTSGNRSYNGWGECWGGEGRGLRIYSHTAIYVFVCFMLFYLCLILLYLCGICECYICDLLD